MKIRILSDLHLEFHDFLPPRVEADIVILAGDIDVEGVGLEWALETFLGTPVLYVFGNHEYYGNAYPKHLNDLKEKAKGTNVNILENDIVTLANITFLGCSLWTDFKLHGQAQLAKREAARYMPDYQKIRYSLQDSPLRPDDTATIHGESLQWLKKSLGENRDTKTVVITHHAPSEKSVPKKFKGSVLSSAFASNLEKVVESSDAELWVHGHMHTASDYQLGRTRVLCNPRGYPNESDTHFIPDLVIDLD
jgi:Icc-related predicted phosphoesterase